MNLENQSQCTPEFISKALNDSFFFILAVFITAENTPCIDIDMNFTFSRHQAFSFSLSNFTFSFTSLYGYHLTPGF